MKAQKFVPKKRDVGMQWQIQGLERGFMRMCTVATTPPYDVHAAHRCNESRGGWTRSIIAESAILIAIDFEWDFFR